MNKAELIDAIASDADLSKSEAQAALDATVNNIEKALKRGDKVTLVGFGTFSVSRRPSRIGRNPRTGASIQIPARNVAKFAAGKALKDSVNS